MNNAIDLIQSLIILALVVRNLKEDIKKLRSSVKAKEDVDKA